MPPPENSVFRGQRAEDIIHVLRDRVALLPGARDRDNRPIVFVPAKENSAQINPDHLRNLLLYLYEVTSDDVKENGFVFVIDMRKGTTWNVVKPVLKCLQEFFPGNVAAVLIIKPENFWEKHKTSVSTGKYKFDIQMISIDNITKYMDAGQIVREFGGSLFYDHEDWLDLRVDIEKLVWRSSEILRHFEKYSTVMSTADIPVDVVKAEEAISKHQKLQSLIASLSVEGVEADVEQLKKRIFNECEYLPVSSNGSILHSTSNPDLSSIFPHLVQLTKTLARTKTELFCQWELKKQELDQCYQMKLFEKDAESAYQWIRAHCNQLSHCFAITGSTESDTERLLTEHMDLTNGVNKYEISYNHVIDVGRRLHKLQSFGVNTIENLLYQLENEWQTLRLRLEQRSRLLKLTFNVHQKCNLFLKKYSTWIENVGVDPSLVMDKSHDELNAYLEEHDNFERVFETVYSEAYADATQLSKMMKKIYGENVGTAQSYKQLLELIQRITHAKRNLHSIWKSRRESIHYRMSSAIFSSDMRSVIDWLEQHGEPFLRRKIAIGQDRVSANSLSINHENFRNVAMNTYRNANQLFTMAAELKNAGEVNEEETTQALLELRRKIDSFRKKVDMRTNLLFIASNFFLHYDEIMAWYCKMDERSASLSVVPESVEECERNKEKLQSENDGTLQAFARVIAEANQLHAALQQQRVVLNVDNSEAIRHVENLARNIENRQAAEKDRWSNQRIYLNAACKVAVFLRDCSEIRRQLLSWREDLKGLKHSVSNKADVVMHYHRQNTESVRSVVADAMNQMGEIVQMIQNKDLQLVLEDRQTRAEEAVTNSANQLNQLEKDVMEIATEVTSRIEHSLQVNKVLKLASDVTEAIQQRQYRLLQMNYIPNSLEDANQAHIIHQQFRSDCENVEGMLRNFHEKYAYANFTIVDPAKRHVTAEVLEQVKNKWSQLVGLTEIRTKLLNTAVSYYKCVSHVIPVSESMEHDLRLDQGDLCVLDQYDSLEKRLEAICKRLNKHTSLKERFLEASLYAQKTSEIFIRYIRRCQASEENISSSEREVNAFKDNVREQQTRILELWFQRKARIEQCQQAVLLQISAFRIGQWMEVECENCVSMISIARSMKASSSRANVEELKLKCLEFKSIVKEKRYEVKQMLEHSKRFLENRLNDFHISDIEQAVQSVPSRFTHILNLARQYELTVNQIAGNGETISTKDELSLDRYSDSTIEEKIEKDVVGENVWNKKMIEPMRELLTSEKDYIDDLRRCIDVYLRSYRMAGSSCPSTLRNKELEIFGNIEQLYDFHSGTFLKELLTYQKNPEDVGYCFIQWMEKLKELYADYCLNKDENNHIICLPEAIKMFSEIRERNRLEHSHDLQSMVIKPVQRITRYRLMLEQLIKSCSTNTKEIKDAYEVVVNIPKLANDRMHLKNFDSYEKYKVGDFIMQDSFVVYEPKRYFKPNRDLQVFLFESNIVFTKKEEIAPKKIRYAYKDSILLCELHVVEHVEGDNTKFGLRKGSQPHQNDMTSVLKANNENTRMLWVKTLRDLKMDMKKASIIDDRLPNLNRVSQVSKDSNTTGEDRYSIASTSSQHAEHYLIAEDFSADCGGGAGEETGQLSVSAGQRVEILDRFALAENQEFVAVAVVEEESGVAGLSRGYVPSKILLAVDPASPLQPEMSPSAEACSPSLPQPSSSAQKRTSLRRFFNSGSNNNPSTSTNQQAASKPPTSAAAPPQTNFTASHRLSTDETSSSTHQHSNGSAAALASEPTPVPPSVLSQPSTSTESPAPASEAIVNSGSRSGALPLNNQPPSADLDLPPPMSQLNFPPLTSSGEESATPAAGCSTPTMNDSSACPHPVTGDLAAAVAEGNGEASSPAPADEQSSAAGTPQGGVAPSGIVQMSAEDGAKVKREYVLKELVETERVYVQDLTSVVEGYIANLSSMELPEDLQGKDKIIFANIAQILDFHKTIFLKEIEKCLENYEAAGNAFVKYERRLNTYYVKYCQNKPKSDFLVSQESFEQFFAETKQQLGHKVALCDLLIKPVQRITKYQLMLSDILKYTQRAKQKADVLEKAFEVMKVVPKACDDMMQVGRLQNFEGNLNAQGRLLFQGTLQISDGGPNQPFRGKERRVFLFEQSAIIADCIPPRKEYGNPTYIFKNQIMVNKMVLDENVPDEPLRFILTSNDPSQPAVFVAQTASMDDKEKWLQKLSAQLDQQKTFLAALVDPKKYQNQLASSVGSLSISGKKDSSSSLGTPPGAPPATSPKHNTATANKTSSKLFGFGKSKS